ncbi:MAG: hypothetical protein ABR498_00265 [Candidatus Dormibacteria bacterium]
MKITVDGITFDNNFYDEDADVLYMHVGDPSTATDFTESVEGHAIRLDDQGAVVGITLVRPRYHIKRGDPLTVTPSWRDPINIDPATLDLLLHAA